MTDRLPGDFDYVIPTGLRDDGGVVVKRHKPSGIEDAVVISIRDGQPIPPGGNIARLAARPEMPGAYDVRVDFDASEASCSGPPKVVSDEYRAGWDLLWGKGGEA